MTPPNLATPAAAVSAEIRLDGGETLTIYTVETVAATWRAALVPPRPTVVDLSRIAQCDTLGLQLLWATKRTVETAGARVTWSNPSPAVLGAAEAIGCENLFNAYPCAT